MTWWEWFLIVWFIVPIATGIVVVGWFWLEDKPLIADDPNEVYSSTTSYRK